MPPFDLPCHSELTLTAQDRDWRAIGVRNADDVRRKQTRCPQCKTSWNAYLRRFGDSVTVEWVRPVPFLVTAAPLTAPAPAWQDAIATAPDPSAPAGPVTGLSDLQGDVAAFGSEWERSVQLCTPVQVLTAQGEVFAVPGDLLLERREKWNAQDRRLALLWAPRLQRQVVAWHSFARLLQDDVSGG